MHLHWIVERTTRGQKLVEEVPSAVGCNRDDHASRLKRQAQNRLAAQDRRFALFSQIEKSNRFPGRRQCAVRFRAVDEEIDLRSRNIGRGERLYAVLDQRTALVCKTNCFYIRLIAEGPRVGKPDGYRVWDERRARRAPQTR